MKKFIIALMFPLSVFAQHNGPYPSGGGSIIISNIVNATNIANAGGITNTQPNVVLGGVYSTFTYPGTNPITAGNAFQAPAVNGTYAWSTVYKSYTNAANTNYVFYFNANLGEWEFTTNNNDTTGNASLYSYSGPNNFPTNDPGNWIFGNANTGGPATPASFDIGNLATSNNPVFSITPSGTAFTDISGLSDPSYLGLTYQMSNGKLLYEVSKEVLPTEGNSFICQYGYAGPAFTNFFDAAHNYSTGYPVYRQKGRSLDTGNEGWSLIVTSFGRLVITNGAADTSFFDANGSIAEFLVRRNTTNSTSVQGGTDMHPLKLDGLGRVMLGNIPQSEHTIYVPANAWVDIREGTAAVPQLLLRKTPAYTGPTTNGYFYSDGQWMHVGENSSDLYILSGPTPNNGSGLNNLNASAIVHKIIQTNFISGQVYNNTYGTAITVNGKTAQTTAAVTGDSDLSLRCDATPANGGWTNDNAIVTTVAVTLAMTYTNYISLEIPTNANWTFTNTSTGAGNTATIIGGQIRY